jgi:hypothetical protein
VETARRGPGAPDFDPSLPTSLAGADAGTPDLFSDTEGNVAAGYQRAGLPVAHVLDGAGPRLLGIEIRTAGFAKDPYSFSFSPSDAWSAVASSAFDFGDGTSAPGPTATHAFPEPAMRRTVTVSATDTAGNVSRAQRPFDVQPALDRTPPVITGLRMDSRRFRISGKETAIAAAVRRGTRFRYTLSEPAQVVVYLERALGGRRQGRRCVRSRKGLRGRRCTLYEPAGLITRAHTTGGAVSLGFTGRLVARNGPLKISDTRLKRGRYRATFVAADALRNVSKPVKTTFTILGR